MITPGGEIVPLVRDPGKEFHFMIDHFRAKPVLERKSNLVVTYARERGQEVDCGFKLEDAEPAPSGPDSAEGINELLAANFGSELTWASRGHDGGGSRSEQQVLPCSVAWAKLEKKWWPARIQDPSEQDPSVHNACIRELLQEVNAHGKADRHMRLLTIERESRLGTLWGQEECNQYCSKEELWEAARDEQAKIPWQEAHEGPTVPEEQCQERFWRRRLD